MEVIPHDIELFYQMLRCCHDLDFWVWEKTDHILALGSQETEYTEILFQLGDVRTAMTEHFDRSNTPVIYTNDLGLSWNAVPHIQDGVRESLYLIGPYFSSEYSLDTIERALLRHRISAATRQPLLELIRQIPALSPTRAVEYTVMLWYCANGTRITAADIVFPVNSGRRLEPGETLQEGFHGTYEMEQELLRMVEEGNLKYKEKLGRLISFGQVGTMANNDALRQARNAIICFITLCSRAAIRGGLPVETSYTLADRYMQAVEATPTPIELAEISHGMLDDYIRRVHQVRTGSLSPQIKAVCDMISLHPERNYSLEELAACAGYSKYHLTKKFKDELGCTTKEYKNRVKIAQAKLLLRTPDAEIQSVAEALNFTSASYFAECFKRETGLTPVEFREKG